MTVNCPHCREQVTGEVLGETSWYEPYESPEARTTLFRCARCDKSFIVIGVQDEDGRILVNTAPITIAGWNEQSSIPEHIAGMYREARLAYRGGAATASALMCRKALEATCRVHDIKDRTLAKALKTATERGIIHGFLSEWAEELRTTGNEAAHDMNPDISDEDARDLVEFTETLLQYVFTYRHRFDQFRKRRQIRRRRPAN